MMAWVIQKKIHKYSHLVLRKSRLWQLVYKNRFFLNLHKTNRTYFGIEYVIDYFAHTILKIYFHFRKIFFYLHVQHMCTFTSTNIYVIAC